MEESLKISKKPPVLKSMRYEELRKLGIQHIQELSGKIWTDYNAHDPGVTMLEVFSYAITDLGHRAGQNIRDIIAQDQSDPDREDIKNFFTAAQILPNKPLTINDIRKVIIDVSVTDENDEGCEFVGVKNAWVSIAPEPEIPVYAHTKESELSYDPDPLNPEKPPLDIMPLYDVLLEFEKCEKYGDLNENELTDTMVVGETADANLKGLKIKVEIEFPRWDEEGVDWNDPESIKAGIQNIKVEFFKKPRRYEFDFDTDDDNNIILSGTKPGTPDPDPVPEMADISNDLNEFVYGETDSLITRYKEKVDKIFEILAQVKARLHANRNLCEDYIRFSALKIEEIAVCADIELELEADVEEVQAQIYYHIANFLSPTVKFHTLKEMADMGIPTEEIFEGPLLDHGFIPDDELEYADRMEVIHVSDLIQIIMDVEDVVAVRKIEIANIPQDNDENIKSQSVKWCLDLAFEHNYIPRLSVTDSKITYFKDQLPYQADQSDVDERIKELEEEDRSQKLQDPVLDIKVPRGNFLDLEDYTSIQNEFPLTYGIGEFGLPSTASEERKARVKQLKGFLMFFDQLFANYMSQLAHVKDLFSMNAERDEDGEYKIGRTYYTQPLMDIVPNSGPLYADLENHPENLNDISEDEALFDKRRNKFLDHLMARFAEQFTDYALLTYRLSGSSGARDLIQDKLTFLNAYPEISSCRGTAFNYMEPCRLWHIDNVSGLEKRAALQMGIDEKLNDKLLFRDRFSITSDAGEAPFGFEVSNDVPQVLLTNPDDTEFDEEGLAKETIEELIVNGICREKYVIKEDSGDYSFTIVCNGKTVAKSEKNDYNSEEDAEQVIEELIGIFEEEFYNNTEANRHNLEAPVKNYFEVTITVDMVPTVPTYKIDYTLYSKAFEFEAANAIMTGSYEGEAAEGDTEDEVNVKAEEKATEFVWDVIISGNQASQYTFSPDEAPFTSPYNLILAAKLGGEVGTSVAEDFNDAVADEFNNLATKTVSVSNAGNNDGDHTFTSASAEGPFVTLQMSAPMPSSASEGELSYTDTLSFSVDKSANTFTLSGDYMNILYNVEQIIIEGSGFNTGEYTIREVSLSGSDTVIEVKEEIASSNADGTLSFTKQYEITNITGSTITIKGGLDDKALQDLISFFQKKFFSNEGIHLIEHILLRPKVDKLLFVPADEGTLDNSLANNGDLLFSRKYDIQTATKSSKLFRVEGDITGELSAGMTVMVEGTENNDGEYKVNSVSLNADRTEIKVQESLEETVSEPQGTISFVVTAGISNVVPGDKKVVISGKYEVTEGAIVEINGSSDGINDGIYRVLGSEISGSDTEIIIEAKEELVQDDLLPVNLDPDCEFCQLENPYTYIATVVLPYWQGRFNNMDFRKLFERRLRFAAPAHIFLNICWISNEHMGELEDKYKKWLVQNSKKEKDKVKLSKALNELIDILSRIRNVYPVGRLHDCEEAETLENSIILNNSILGNA